MASSRLTGLVRESRSSGTGAQNLILNERVRELSAAGRDVINFSFGQSPFPPMELAVKALQQNAHRTKYEPVKGILPLRQAIAKSHMEREELHFDPANIVVGPGSKELIFLLMNVFEGDVILPSPAWVTYKPQAVLAGHHPVIMELRMDDEWRVTPAVLEETLFCKCSQRNKLLVFCNPDNPTGATYTREQLEALVPVIRKHNIVVLSDEIYGYLEFSGSHTSLAAVCPEHTILSSGLSKWACSGGWRLGYQAYPEQLSELSAAVTHAASHTYTSASSPIQYAAVEIFNNVPACREFTSHCTRILDVVARFVCRELSSHGVKVLSPSGGFYVLADFEDMKPRLAEIGISTCNELFARIMEDANVALLPAGPCLLRPETEFTARLSYTDFDGSKALEASRSIPLSDPLPEDFVHVNCARVVKGMQLLTSWITEHCT